MSKKENEPNKRLSECVLNWIDKLSTHFGSPQDEEQVKVFLHALRDCTTYQVETAFERCLNECEFMPRLAQVHERMPEQKYAPENPGAYVLNGPPILDLVRKVVQELYPNLTNLDGKERYEAFRHANQVRYERMGIDWKKWGK